jgi:hypothetical protein
MESSQLHGFLKIDCDGTSTPVFSEKEKGPERVLYMPFGLIHFDSSKGRRERRDRMMSTVYF